MNRLAIETATTVCAVGVATSAGVEITRVVDESRRHTEALVPAVANLLDECGITARDLDCVVVDLGPGLFTGLRVGVAAANAFAQALGCGVVGATSLELLARGAWDAGVRGTLVAAVDGRRGEVFVQRFGLADDVEAVEDPSVATPATVAAQWTTLAAPVTFTGDGVDRYLDVFSSVPAAELFAQAVPSLHAALALATARPGRDQVVPLYLREADAVANFATRRRS